MYGYFDDADQDVPAVDPGPNALCPYCKEILRFPVTTISFMWEEHPSRSYFYRAHKSCYQEATPEQRSLWEILRLNTNMEEVR